MSASSEPLSAFIRKVNGDPAEQEFIAKAVERLEADPCAKAKITRDERRLHAVAGKVPREVYAYVTEAAKRLFDREGKHLVIDVDDSGDRLDFRLLDLEEDLGVRA